VRYTSQTDAHIIRRLSADPARFVRGFGSLTQVATGVATGAKAASAATTIGTGIATAIGAGASAGSVVPIVGTALGVLVALVASGVFSHRVDPEVGSFNNAIALANAQGPQAVLNIQDKYLVLAGLFDLEPGQIKGNIPIYKRYGRMGEHNFVLDMCNLIQAAANSGAINDNDTVQSVYDKIVVPWMNSWGLGQMQDTNAQMITYIIMGLIGEYVTGQYSQRWFAVGGDYAFGTLAPFTLPSTPSVPVTSSATPSPVTAPAQPAVTAASNAAAVAVLQAQAAAAVPTELQRYQGGAIPSIGGAINYTRDSSGNWMALPQVGYYAGIAPGGAWIVNIAGGQYTLSNGTLTPYSSAQITPVVKAAPPATAIPIPAGTPQMSPVIVPLGVNATMPAPVASSTPAVSATDSSGTSIPAQYIPAPSPAGGTYPSAPLSVAPPVATATPGFSIEELGIGAALLLGVYLLATHKKGS
jgi:hypothetical protein